MIINDYDDNDMTMMALWAPNPSPELKHANLQFKSKDNVRIKFDVMG